MAGNPGHRAIPEGPECDPLTEVPTPPRWLDATGKKYWAQVLPWFVENRLIAEKDLGALEGLCDAYSQMITLRRKARKDSRLLTPARLAGSEFRKFCAEFGLTASSATRVSRPTAKRKPEGWGKFA